MAKDKERKTARILYVEQGRNQKEIAQLLGITPRSVGSWVQKYGWKKERTARTATPGKRIDNIKAIITQLSEERLELTEKVHKELSLGNTNEAAELRKEISKIDAGVANWNKTLITIEAENKINLSVYITVMERIFDAMRISDIELFMKSIPFQEQHLQKITIELG